MYGCNDCSHSQSHPSTEFPDALRWLFDPILTCYLLPSKQVFGFD